MKRFTKIVALLLAVAMVFSLAACGKGSTTDNQAKTGPYTIGINTWGSGVPVLDMFGDAKEYTLTTLGHKVSRMSDDFNADKELQNIKNMCAAGVDGVVFEAAAVSTVPQIGVECANAKIPFAFDVFVGENPDLEKLAAETGIPFDPLPRGETSGVRFGTPAITSRGMKEAETEQIGKWILEIMEKGDEVTGRIKDEVKELCSQYPLYPHL